MKRLRKFRLPMRPRVLIGLILLFGSLFLAVAPEAGADPNPIVGDCKTTPEPQSPHDGLSGWIDSGPVNAAKTAGNNLYTKYGKTPPWHNYDLGCAGNSLDVPSQVDTTFANWIMGIAVVTVSITAALHRVVSPPSFLHSLDPLLNKGTTAIGNGIYIPWLPVSLILLAVIIIWQARRKNLPLTVKAGGWALLVMATATAAMSYPAQAGKAADSLTSGTIAAINSAMLGEDPNHPDQDTSSSRTALLVDTVEYKQWVKGELGSEDSDAAKHYGMALFNAQELTYQEDALPKAQRQAVIDKKKSDFKNIAVLLQGQDSGAYGHLKGSSGSRIGPAFTALLAAFLTCPFMIMADLLIIAALLIWRLGVIFFPAIAVIGLHKQLSGVIKTAFSMVGAALLNSVIFAAGAGINALGVGVLLGPGIGLPIWIEILLCGVLTFILWHALKPFRKLTSMVNPGYRPKTPLVTPDVDRHKLWKGVKRFGATVAATRIGAKGALDAHDEETSEHEHHDEPMESFSSRPAYAEPGWDHSFNPSTPEAAPMSTLPASIPSPDVSYRDSSEPVSVPPQKTLPSTGVAIYDPHHRDDIIPADAKLPEGIIRADPVVDSNGHQIHRVWNPATQTYDVVDVGESNA